MLLNHPRKLAREELAVLRRLIEVAPTRHFKPEMLTSIETLQVIEVCDCGCATIWFAPDGASSGTIVAEAETMQGGSYITVVVWGKGSALAGLEVVGPGITPLPSPDSAWTPI